MEAQFLARYGAGRGKRKLIEKRCGRRKDEKVTRGGKRLVAEQFGLGKRNSRERK